MPNLTGPGDATQPPPYDTSYWSSEQLDGPMTVYDVVMSYLAKGGLCQMPVSGQATDTQVGYGKGGGSEPVPCEIVRIAAPVMRVRADWKARRVGLPVILPDWRPPSGSSKYTLNDCGLSGKNPTLGSDGVTYTFHAEGFAEYLLKLPLTPADGYPMAAAPYQTLPTSVMGITAAQFRQTIFPL